MKTDREKMRVLAIVLSVIQVIFSVAAAVLSVKAVIEWKEILKEYEKDENNN